MAKLPWKPWHEVVKLRDDLRSGERLLQSLIELSPHGKEERSLLESISNHGQGRGAVRDVGPMLFPMDEKGRPWNGNS